MRIKIHISLYTKRQRAKKPTSQLTVNQVHNSQDSRTVFTFSRRFCQKVALRNEWFISSYIWKNRHSIFSNLSEMPLQPLRFYHTFQHQQLMCSVFVILHTDEGPSSDILHDLFMLLMTSSVTLQHCDLLLSHRKLLV